MNKINMPEKKMTELKSLPQGQMFLYNSVPPNPEACLYIKIDSTGSKDFNCVRISDGIAFYLGLTTVVTKVDVEINVL